MRQVKHSLESNPERHLVRMMLADRRRQCYKVTFGIRKMREKGIEPKPDKLAKLRVLRKECRQLSRRLRVTAPYLTIEGKKEVWLGKSFKRFRHSSRSIRWTKSYLFQGWKQRTENDSSNAP